MYRILSGENELTANLIEISYKETEILTDAGISLVDGENYSKAVRTVLSVKYDAVVISHGHIDHIGLISRISKDIPVYMGEKTLELYKLRKPGDDFSNYRTYRDGVSFKIGGIIITPFLCDHSSPDSFMLYFESPEERILYTGDYRSKGRKNFKKLLSGLPENVDVLITEFTNADRSCTYSERYAEEKMTEIIKSSDTPVFVLCSTSNIDRITGIYKAAVKNSRELLIDEDQERVMEIYGETVPNALTFENVKIYYPHGIKDFENVRYIKGKAVSLNSLKGRNDFVMIVKTSSLGFIKKMAEERDLNGSVFIYSLWSGYKEQDRMKDFLKETEKLGIKVITVHASGHADRKAVDDVKRRVKPKETRFVHTR